MSKLTEMLKPSAMMVVNLLDHVSTWDKDPYLDCLVEPSSGIYLPSSVNPVLDDNGVYYPQSKYGQDQYRIKDLDSIFNLGESIVDKNGIVVFTWVNLKRFKKYITLTPQVPATAIKVAHVIVDDFLRGLCPYTNTPRNKHSLHQLTTNPDLILIEAYEELLDDLIMEVSEFVGKDRYHIYFTKLKGTSLIIEKTIDFRVYDWYRMRGEIDEQDS